MLRHSLLLTYRHFKKYKSSFFINLIGLSTGLACVLLIYLWVNDELWVDKFHEKDSRLYQVMLRNESANEIEVGREMPPVLAQTLAEEFPEVEYAVTEVVNSSKNTITVEDKIFKVAGIYAGKDYFNTFSYPLIHGDKNQVLANENAIVISEDLAMKLFNTSDKVVGRSVMFDNKEQFLISGIYTIPENSSKKFSFILPHKVVFKQFPNVKNDWSSSFMFNTYLVLKEGTNIDAFNHKIKDVLKARSNQQNLSLFATTYSDIYLYGRYEEGVQSGGRIEYVRLFSIIAFFILLIACINFMNLSTAKASRRTKEVGIKKAVGASREILIFQYMCESVLMVFLSLLIAVILVLLLLPQFNEITGKTLILYFETNLVLVVLGIALLTGLISGSYPALYLSGFKPGLILKGGATGGKLNNSAGELLARKGLVVFQFSLSIVFIIAVSVVYKQIEFIQNKSLGYNKNNIIYFEMDRKLKDHRETFLMDVKKLSGITHASSIFKNFLGDLNSTSDLSWKGKGPNSSIQMQYRRVNYEMMELLGVDIKEGRAFSKDFGSDDNKVIFNEAAIEVMGLEDPIGKSVKLWGSDFEVLGVVKDFHFESLHERVRPVFFILSPERTNTIMLKIDPQRFPEAITHLKSYYSGFTGGMSLDYKFLDEVYQAQYIAEQRVSFLSRYFAGIAILISCLGLYGLVAFSAEQRRKEIGIRKVLGASVLSIVSLLSKDFLKLVLLAAVIAFPIAWYAMHKWLEDFAYRIDVPLWVFFAAGIVAAIVAFLTISFQSIKAATANPVKNLRTE